MKERPRRHRTSMNHKLMAARKRKANWKKQTRTILKQLNEDAKVI